MIELEEIQKITLLSWKKYKKGQMGLPNLLMVVATLAVLMVFIPVIQNAITQGNVGVSTTSPEWIISNATLGVMVMFALAGIIVYALIRW
jgi:hypothetical protein